MGDPPRHVTVGMPVYNDPDGLRRSVPTVFGQTWEGDLRLLIIDDGSDEVTAEVLAELSTTYGAIDIVRNVTNRGRPHVRNQILEHAGDGYLAWIDAGDLWHPRKLEVQFATLDADSGDPRHPVVCVTPLRRHFVDRGVASVKVPDVEGDQLYGALTGRIFGYLPTMLGRADDFRNMGFDERLLRRQDYDLLVRFVASGGRIVCTPDDLPLFTYLKSDVGASAATVARVNRVIRDKHRPYYERYGSEVGRRVKRNQHLLVARFYDSNGKRLRASAYRWLARLADPSVVMMGIGRVARGSLSPLRRPLGGLVRLFARRARGVLPTLHRLGIVSLARRIGLVRVAARLGLMRTFYTELKEEGGPLPSTEEIDRWAEPGPGSEGNGAMPPVLRRAHNLMLGNEHPRAIALLEEMVDGAAGSAPTEVWLVLEEAYRRDGRLHSAQRTLERGLRRHPDDRRLELRLAELFGLRRDWGSCVDRWFALRAETDEDLTPLSYSRVARSLRMLDRPVEAVEVAEEGLRRWPDDGRLAAERDQSRALTVDWSHAVYPTVGGPDSLVAVGVITDLGFLAGGGGPVEGEVHLSSQHAPKVSLRLNGCEIASTYASLVPGDGGTGRFSLNCRDVMDYVGDGDILALESGGSPVLSPDGGRRLIMAPGYDSRAEELQRKLEAGYVFMKFGRLSLGNTPERKRRILDLYDEISGVFEQDFGYALFPFYGNLLGAIRDNDFIEHDVGGFDVSYVSEHVLPGGVRGELVDMCRRLAARGYHLELKPFSVYVRAERGDKVFVDINFAWFNPAGELNVSYGWRYEPVKDRERLLMPRECPIHGHLVRVPGNAEAVLEQLYGPDWPIPIQGFDPDAGITRETDYLLSRAEMESLEAAEPDRIRVRSILTADGEVVPVG
jgi:glycosyltransferase involved in cell wall biosynthesis